MLLAGLLIIATALTCTMFASGQAMLGFPCLIFWAIMGGYCYQESVATWDMYYFTFFASFGMAIFSAFAAFGLRTKKEELAKGDGFIDEGKDDIKFIDEENGSGRNVATDVETEPGGENPSRRTRGIRDRAAKRRSRWA